MMKGRFTNMVISLEISMGHTHFDISIKSSDFPLSNDIIYMSN